MLTSLLIIGYLIVSCVSIVIAYAFCAKEYKSSGETHLKFSYWMDKNDLYECFLSVFLFWPVVIIMILILNIYKGIFKKIRNKYGIQE